MCLQESNPVSRIPAVLLGFGMLALWACTSVAEEIAPGVTYSVYSAPGPNVVYVVAVDRLRSEYKLEVGWAQGRRNYTARETTSTIAGRYDNPPGHNVLSAVNGSYFDPLNAPRVLGVAQSAGQMMDTPAFNSLYQYHTMMVGPARTPSVVTNFNHALGTLTFPDGFSMILHQYNFNMNGPLTPINNQTFAFTSSFDSVTAADFSAWPSGAVEVILSDVSYPMRGGKEVSGIVTALVSPTNGHNAIPAGGMVLSTWGTTTKPNMLAHAHVGDRLRMRFPSGADEYNNSDNAITGIGWVIHNGSAYTPGWANLESGASPSAPNPRTVLAWNDTTWYQIVCDGRSGVSVGMTFQEMADFLIGALGATEAVNYDGGGSSTMVVNGTVRNVPSESGIQRAVANAIMLVKQDTATVFPFTDAFGPAGRLAGWDDKFRYSDVVPFSPTSPGGDGYVIKVMNAGGGADSTRRGDFGDTDYTVEADVYCEYRPEIAADGHELSGIFARDSGTGAMGLTNYGKGNCYALLFASDTGLVMPGKYVDGVWTSFLETPPSVTASGWHRLRIDCYGSRVRFRLDGQAVATVLDSTHPRGYWGIGYHEAFATDANMHGARADNFLAHVVPGAIQPGDFDGDDDVDQVDFGRFQICLSGSTNPQTLPECQEAHFDADSDVDGTDFSLFLGCLSGPEVAADPGCVQLP